MKKILKSIAMTAAILMLTSVIWGCRTGGDVQGDADADTPGESDFYIYYINDRWTDISGKKMDVDQLASAENKVDLIMKALLEGGGTSDLMTPVPAGMVYQRYIYDGYGTINLIFNVDPDSTDAYSIVLSKLAFVKTLCQIDSIQTVVYEMVDTDNENNVVQDALGEDSFADIGNIMDSEKEMRIYLPDSSGKTLVEKSLTLDYSHKESLPEQVIQGLESSYDGTVTPFNDKTVVKGISLDEGLCTVTFNDAFVNGKDGVDDSILVYSIVDSLMELDNVKMVQLRAENTGNRLNAIDLEKKFTGDYSYVTK